MIIFFSVVVKSTKIHANLDFVFLPHDRNAAHSRRAAGEKFESAFYNSNERLFSNLLIILFAKIVVGRLFLFFLFNCCEKCCLCVGDRSSFLCIISIDNDMRLCEDKYVKK